MTHQFIQSGSCTYLDLVLDELLNWREPVDKKCESTKCIIFAVNKCCRLSWGVSCDKIKINYYLLYTLSSLEAKWRMLRSSSEYFVAFFNSLRSYYEEPSTIPPPPGMTVSLPTSTPSTMKLKGEFVSRYFQLLFYACSFIRRPRTRSSCLSHP